MTFDRLIYIDRLKEAGLPDAVARAHAEALREALFETVATKTDLNEVRTELKEDIRALRDELKTDIRALRDELKTDIRAVRTELNDVRIELKEDIRSARLDMKDAFETLDRKIEITSRDLVIRGAAGLVVIASIIVGLKLFG